jgi:hypothetical protein
VHIARLMAGKRKPESALRDRILAALQMTQTEASPAAGVAPDAPGTCNSKRSQGVEPRHRDDAASQR